MLSLHAMRRLGLAGITLLLAHNGAFANVQSSAATPLQPIPVQLVASPIDERVYSLGGLCWLSDSDPAKKPIGSIQSIDAIHDNSSRIDMPNACPYDAAITSNGNTLYVASQVLVNNAPYAFMVSSLDTHKQIFSPYFYYSATRPDALALSADNKKLFIATSEHMILVVNTLNNVITDVFGAPAGSLNTMVTNPKEEELYAVYNRDGVYRISTRIPHNAKLLFKIGSLRHQASLTMSQDGKVLYAAIPQAYENKFGTTIYGIDVTSAEPVAKVLYQSSHLLSLSPSLVTDNNLIYFVDTNNKNVSAFDVAKGQIVKQVATEGEATVTDMVTLPVASTQTAYIASFDYAPARAVLSKVTL